MDKTFQKKSFNLVTDNWINVLNGDFEIETISLKDFFTHAKDYISLAGESEAQNLSVLRFLLAIMHKTYSIENEVSPTDNKEQIEKAALNKWKQIYKNYRADEVVAYLEENQASFDLFGDKPFYQVTRTQYNELVPDNKQINAKKLKDLNNRANDSVAVTGTITVKQFKRTISESSNTPNLFALESERYKNKITFDELARWLISFQGYTATSDKTAIKNKEKFSKSPGWLFKINPVFAVGDDMFDTLMLNLKLDSPNKQKPVWEYDNPLAYIDKLRTLDKPNNITELYTNLSRAVCIEWDDFGRPAIFSAGLPQFDSADYYNVEPMTSWRVLKKDIVLPNTKKPDEFTTALWRSIGEFIPLPHVEIQDGTKDNSKKRKSPKTKKPLRETPNVGLMEWLTLLRNNSITESILTNKTLTLKNVLLLKSQQADGLPVDDFNDSFDFNADLLVPTDSDSSDLAHGDVKFLIADALERIRLVHNALALAAKDIAELRYGEKGQNNSKFVNEQVKSLYNKLDDSFNEWFSSIDPTGDLVEKSDELNEVLRKITYNFKSKLYVSASSKEINGTTVETKAGKTVNKNIYTVLNSFDFKIRNILR
ncbi:type I-E CRISPR-associated protein Cse1/CasA [Ligilactobacillus equi]|uniref:type I-E CRISPR-associated protein Cse1/CasA n=1 Tax=Ligilactobacillus equi TaxID=137357 RepID=UPI00046A5175|nr:type I-E CRISPR-associated protein Cse1/CasA [Ligilactobacillus equi]